MRMQARRLGYGDATGLVGLALLLSAALVGAQQPGVEAPLPERDVFLQKVREGLRSDNRLLSQYTFTEREMRAQLDAKGRETTRTERIYEVYPSLEGSPSYRRLISRNGIPLPAAELEKADAKHRRKVLEWLHSRERETETDRTKRAEKERAARLHEDRLVSEVFRIYDFEIIAREIVRDRPTIVLALRPNRGINPTMSEASMLTKIAGRAWVDEQDHQVTKLELETIDTITVGLGLLARVHKGTTFGFERQKVNDEAWLPMRATVHPRGRIALFKRLDTHVVREYGDYRKFGVDTAVSFTLPKST